MFVIFCLIIFFCSQTTFIVSLFILEVCLFVVLSVNNMFGDKMKRYILSIIFVIVIVLIALCLVPQSFVHAVTRNATTAKCFVYCRSTELPSTSVGYGYIVECEAGELSDVLNHCQNIDGISLSFSASEQEFWQIVKRCNFVKSNIEYFPSLITVCGYTRRLSGGIYVGNTFTNLQLAYNDGTVYIGSPLILGSY